VRLERLRPTQYALEARTTKYNDASFENPFTLNFTLGAMTEEELPSACLACGECTELCPQEIDIPDIMAKFAETLANRPKMGPPPIPVKPAGSAK